MLPRKQNKFFSDATDATQKNSKREQINEFKIDEVSKDLFGVAGENVMIAFAQEQGFVPVDDKYDGLETGKVVDAIMEQINNERETVGFSHDNFTDSNSEDSEEVNDAAITPQEFLMKLKKIDDQNEESAYIDWVQKVFASAEDLFQDLMAKVDAVFDEQEEASKDLQEYSIQLSELDEGTEEYYNFYVDFLNLLKTEDRFGEEVDVIKSEINCLVKIFEKIYFDQGLKYPDEISVTLSVMLTRLRSAADSLSSRLGDIDEELCRFLALVEAERKFKDEISKKLKEYPELVQWMCDFDDKFQAFFPSSEFNCSAASAPACRVY